MTKSVGEISPGKEPSGDFEGHARMPLPRLAPLALLAAAPFILAAPALAASAPAPVPPVPNARQIAWHDMEYYGFIHLGLNTFTDKEWGYGDEDPAKFNPSAFNADQIVASMKASGMKGIILTAKHHDGFCLWPTKTSKHNIAKTPWKDGKGDVVREFANACKAEGMHFGVYISPWDRNHAEYARPGYLKDYYTQIQELLTDYGPIFEIWFDGANGGDGWYGGKKETRKIPDGYYNFPLIVKNIRRMQPNCIIWGAGSNGDARWGGSEQGHVGYPHWHTLDSKKGGNGAKGFRDGDRWVPAEGDTSIRHGWFWHEAANNSVKSPAKLLQVWLECVGRGGNLILNVPPNQHGRIHDGDATSLLGFKALRDELYASDYALGATAKASNVRGNDARFAAAKLVDADIETYWAGDDDVTTPSAEIRLKAPATFDVIRVRENIRLGQRVEAFAIDAMVDGKWSEIAKGESIGNQVMLQLKDPVTTDQVRLRILKSPATPAISELSLLCMPTALDTPRITRQADGKVRVEGPDGLAIRYTTDGSDPVSTSPAYASALDLPARTVVKARVFAANGKAGPIATSVLGISKAGWKVLVCTAGDARKALDEDPKTFWASGAKPAPQGFAVDIGTEEVLRGFTYLPRQDDSVEGMTDRFRFEVSTDNKTWTKVAEGEFSNLRANPIEQTVRFKADTKARYFRFTAQRAIEGDNVTAAEIGLF